MYNVRVRVEAPLNKQHPQLMKGHVHGVIVVDSSGSLTKQQAKDKVDELCKQLENDDYFKSYEIVDETF
jgi:polyhydroxyalkanoate synthesis regulator phasin